MAVKKPKLVYEKETPPPSLTRGTQTTEGTAPIKRIDLTKDQGFAEYSKSASNKAEVLDYESKLPKYEVSNGVHTLTLPNGRRIEGTPEELRDYKRNYMALKGIKDPRIMQAQRAEIESELDRAALKKSIEEERMPDKVTPEQLSAVGQIDENILGEQNLLSAEIQRKAEQRYAETRIPGTNIPSPMISPNKFTGQIAGFNPLDIPIGKTIMSLAGNNEKLRDYLEDYKMDDEYTQVKNQIREAETVMNGAIKQANKGIDKDDAIKNYNAGYTRLLVAEQQLKAISQSDQREYVDSVKNSLSELQSSLRGEIKRQNDENMRLALQKKYVEEMIMNSEVQ